MFANVKRNWFVFLELTLDKTMFDKFACCNRQTDGERESYIFYLRELLLLNIYILEREREFYFHTKSASGSACSYTFLWWYRRKQLSLPVCHWNKHINFVKHIHVGLYLSNLSKMNEFSDQFSSPFVFLEFSLKMQM